MMDDLLNRQNKDGGWSYRPGGASWTEPTCYSMLALLAAGRPLEDENVRRAAGWLSSRQTADGGWSPQAGVTESTWVTALVLLLPPELRPPDGVPPIDMARAESWVQAQTGRESGFLFQLRLRLLGAQVDPAQAFDGWPWFPGAAAWVAPTAVSILALEKLRRRAQAANPDPNLNKDLEQRLQQGRAYLLARRCKDGGWNHGSTRALGYDSDSYPETTGLALLALHGAAAGSDPAQLAGALESARRHLANCDSLEAASWLTLALAAHGDKLSAPQQAAHGGTNEIALAVIATEALRGRNVFVS